MYQGWNLCTCGRRQGSRSFCQWWPAAAWRGGAAAGHGRPQNSSCNGWSPGPRAPILCLQPNPSSETQCQASLLCPGKEAWHANDEQVIDRFRQHRTGSQQACVHACVSGAQLASRLPTKPAPCALWHHHPSALQIGSSKTVSINEIPVNVAHHWDGGGRDVRHDDLPIIACGTNLPTCS